MTGEAALVSDLPSHISSSPPQGHTHLSTCCAKARTLGVNRCQNGRLHNRRRRIKCDGRRNIFRGAVVHAQRNAVSICTLRHIHKLNSTRSPRSGNALRGINGQVSNACRANNRGLFGQTKHTFEINAETGIGQRCARDMADANAACAMTFVQSTGDPVSLFSKAKPCATGLGFDNRQFNRTVRRKHRQHGNVLARKCALERNTIVNVARRSERIVKRDSNIPGAQTIFKDGLDRRGKCGRIIRKTNFVGALAVMGKPDQTDGIGIRRDCNSLDRVDWRRVRDQRNRLCGHIAKA